MRARLKKILAGFATLFIALALALFWLGATESGLHWLYQQARNFVPAEISIEKIEGRLFGSIQLSGVRYQRDEMQIGAEHIDLQWQPMALLMARLHIERLHVQSLKITVPATEQNDQPLMLPDVTLPFQIVLEDTIIDDIKMIQPDNTLAIKQISINADTRFSRMNIESLNIIAERFEFNITGTVRSAGNYDHDLSVRWQAQLPASETITGTGTIKGNIDALSIRQQLSGPFQLSLNAGVRDVLGQLTWQADINASAIDLARIDAALPAITGKIKLQAQGDIETATVTGRIEADYPDQGPIQAAFELKRSADNTIHIDQLALHAPETNSQLNLRGNWTPDAGFGHFALELDGQHLRWPLRGTAWFDTASAHGSIEGNLDHYLITLTTERLWPQAPASTWHARAEGNLEGLNMRSLRITALDGEVNLTGEIQWSPQLRWHADIKAGNINPAERWPQWPGALNATLTSTGRLDNDELNVNVDITELTGSLRHYPVTAHSRLSWRTATGGDGPRDVIDVHAFEFNSGDSTVSASGRLGASQQLDWTINAASLAQLYPRSGGQLTASGHISGSQASPVIEATVNGSALSLHDFTVGSVKGSLAIDLFSWQQINIDLIAETLAYKNSTLQSLHIAAVPDRFELTAINEAINAQLILDGAANEHGWRGQITKADIISERFADWQLETATALTLSKDTLLIDTPCWRSNDSRLCLSVEQAQQYWHMQLTGNKLPLRVFSPWLPPDLKLEGAINANADMRLTVPDQLLGQLDIELLPGAVSYPLLEGEREHWPWRGGRFNIKLDEKEITANTAITMNANDRFKAELALPGAQLLQLDRNKQTMQARAQFDLNDLGLVEALIPDVQDLTGKIELSASVSGTLAQPRISGRAQLKHGALRIPRLGLDIDRLTLNSFSDGREKLSYKLEAHSGDGDLVVQGYTLLDSDAGWPATMTVKGERFEVARIPEARVSVSPDLKVTTQARTINVSGDVHVPFAKLQPKDITTATRVSDDVVIVGGEQRRDEKWTIISKVRITLGERVTFYGFGFEGSLGGSVLLEDRPGQLTRATGEINVVEGRYHAYGQRLEIEHGRLLYTGGPVSNPGLDLRAVRTVNNVTAGLKVRGSLNRPQVELFSIPSMGQTDALSYLLLGRPLETATGSEGGMMAKAALALSLSGGDSLARSLGDRFGFDEMRVESDDTGEQASLVVGRYLSPKLYVSYGIGLVEAFNTFYVRYQISEKWQLRGESGESHGADLFYIIER